MSQSNERPESLADAIAQSVSGVEPGPCRDDRCVLTECDRWEHVDATGRGYIRPITTLGDPAGFLTIDGREQLVSMIAAYGVTAMRAATLPTRARDKGRERAFGELLEFTAALTQLRSLDELCAAEGERQR